MVDVVGLVVGAGVFGAAVGVGPTVRVDAPVGVEPSGAGQVVPAASCWSSQALLWETSL